MQRSRKTRIIREVFAHFKHYVAMTLFFNISGQVILGFATILFKQFLDNIPQLSALSAVLPLILYYILLKIVQTILFFIDEYPYRVIHTGTYQWAKIKALEKIKNIDYLSYLNIGTGQIIQQIENHMIFLIKISNNTCDYKHYSD